MAVSLHLEITQNSQNISANTSNVTVVTKCYYTNGSYNTNWQWGGVTIDGTEYTWTSQFNTTQRSSGYTTLNTKTLDIAHNSDGTKTLECSAWYRTGVSSGEIKATGSLVLDTIPRASSLTAANGTLNTAQTLKITRASDTFKHKITYSCGTAWGYAAGTESTYSTATSISWTPPLSLASQNTTGVNVSVTLKLYTYDSSGTQIGTTSKSIYCAIPASVKPSCSIAVTDAKGYASTFGNPVKGKSTLKVVITPTLAYSSPIASYAATANDYNYATSSFTTTTLKKSGTLTVSATVKDKRGRSGSATQNVTVLDYTEPTVTKLAVHRCDSSGTEDDQGAYVKVTFSASVTSLNSKNTSSFKVQYKKSTDSSYTTYTISSLANKYAVTDNTYIFAADPDYSYDVALVVADYFTSTSKSTSASTAFTLMHWNATGTGIAFGKLSEKENAVEFGLPLYDTHGQIRSYVEGTSGIWTYRKWSTGECELWGVYAVSNKACTTALGNMYRTDAFSVGSFPFTITNPVLVASYESDGYGGMLWATTTTTTTAPPSYYLIRPTSATIASGKIIFHVTGKWQ